MDDYRRAKLNDDKTKFMIIGNRAQLDMVDVSEIVVGQAKVPAVRSVRDLGTWFDMNLAMSTHINNTCLAIVYYLYYLTH